MARLLSCFALMSGLALAQQTTLTTSSSFSQTAKTLNVTRDIFLERTRVVGRSLAGTVVYDVTFDLPPKSPQVKEALVSAAQVFRAYADTASVKAPVLVNQSRSRDTQITTTRKGTSIIGVSRVEILGPATIRVGALSTAAYPCRGYIGGGTLGIGGLKPGDGFQFRFTRRVTPLGCPPIGGKTINVASGRKNIDTLTHIHTDIEDTVTSTLTLLTTNVFEVVDSSGVEPPRAEFTGPAAPDDKENLGIQVRYLSNLDRRDAEILATNSGARGAGLPAGLSASTTGAICLNVYAFAADNQLVACCSCPVTPNGLAELSARRDLLSLLPSPLPTSLIVKLYATVPTSGSCAGSAWSPGPGAPGLHAWATTLVGVKEGFPDIATGDFLRTSSTVGERDHLAERCTALNAGGSGFNVCRSCRLGAADGGRLP